MVNKRVNLRWRLASIDHIVLSLIYEIDDPGITQTRRVDVSPCGT